MNHPSIRQLRVAIVGCGPMARHHARLLAGHVPLANLAACDRDPVRLADFAATTGIDRTYPDLNVLLEDFGPDIVHVVTPPATHRDLAVRCLEAGAHVLIEKPMCLTLDEADAIIEAAQRSGKLVAVDHMRSFDPLLAKARALLDSGRIGTLVRVSVGYSHDYLSRRDSDPAARWMGGLPGGWIFDLMPHVMCLVADLVPGARVAHHTVRRNDDGIITDLGCLLTSGTVDAHLHMSLDVVPLKNYVELECTTGTVRVDFRNFLVTVRRHRGLPNAIERVVGNLDLGGQMVAGSLASVGGFVTGRLDSYAGLDRIIGELLQAVVTGGPSPVPATTARHLLALTTEILGSDITPVPERESALPPAGPAGILVTGGTGFIGRRLVERLAVDHQVRVLTHRRPCADELARFGELGVEVVHGDVADPEAMRRACQGVETVYHLAAAMRGDWSYHLDATVTGTGVVARAAVEAGVERLVAVSTLNVYDASRYPDGIEIDEDFPEEAQPHRRGAYSHAKLLAERELRATDRGDVALVVVRPGLVYGPGSAPIPGDVGIRLGRRGLVVLGGGGRRIPFVYVDNLVDALVAAGGWHGPGGELVVNLVDPNAPTQREYLRWYRRITGRRMVTVYVPFRLVLAGFWLGERVLARIGGPKVSLVHKLASIRHSPVHSTRRATEVLGWQPAVGFEEGLRRTIGATGTHLSR